MSGKQGVAIFLVTFMVLLTIQITRATTYEVGDSAGWTFGVSSWPNDKHFKSGDVLVFNYPPGVHNVVIVNKENYDTCEASGRTFTSGNDTITLNNKGTLYFICGIPGHCDAGQKIAVTTN